MKLGGIPQSPIERIGKALGLLPQPLLDTHVAMLLARAIMEEAARRLRDRGETQYVLPVPPHNPPLKAEAVPD